MKCQDIARIVDTGDLGKLSEAERYAAETHALSCRSCAPAWAVHSRLAGMRVAPMPAGLELQCRGATEALPSMLPARPALRRLVVVGGLVAMAAAAAIIALRVAGVQEPGFPLAATTSEYEPIPELAPPSAPAATAAPAVSEVVPLQPAPAEALTPQAAGLPLLPIPPASNLRQRLEELVLIAVERHPELVEGPAMDGRFAVALTLRADGNVLSSAALAATQENFQAVNAELERMLPRDGGSSTSMRRGKELPLSDGRFLRADIELHIATVPAGYDLTRSSVRVLEILGDKYAHLMLPATDVELKRLTVFLSEDGSILREKVQVESTARQNPRTLRADDPNDVAFLAEFIASELELDAAQIGLLGFAALEEGTLKMVVDASGNARTDDQRKLLVVRYAWQRGEGESGPRWGQGSLDAPGSRIDLARALTIVEQVIPDAFAPRDPAAGNPTVVLTAKGKLIDAGRVISKSGEPIQKTLQDQLVPGVQLGSFSSVRLTDKSGATADIVFAWEVPVIETPGP